MAQRAPFESFVLDVMSHFRPPHFDVGVFSHFRTYDVLASVDRSFANVSNFSANLFSDAQEERSLFPRYVPSVKIFLGKIPRVCVCVCAFKSY